VRIGEIVAAAVMTAAVLSFSAKRVIAAGATGGQPLDHFLLFSGVDLWHDGGFVHGGVLWSPNGLGREGFTLKVLIAGGRYRYNSGTTPIRGHQALTAVMPGWRIVNGHTALTLFAGLDLQSNHFVPDDPTNSARGRHAGLRAGADFWSEPVPGVMVAAAVSASTIGPSIWSRVATGVRLFDRFWVGPELQVMGDSHYQQFRAGAHLTSLRFGRLEWSVGFGYAIDSDDRDGAYARIGLVTRQ
jgi:hypothetical protein